MFPGSLQGMRSSAAAGTSRGLRQASAGRTPLEHRRCRALARMRSFQAHAGAPPAVETEAAQAQERVQAHGPVGQLRAGQERLAAMTAQLEALAPGANDAAAVAEVVAGLNELSARLERVADELRCEGESSSSSSSEDECMDAEAAAKTEAMRMRKDAKMAEKAAKKAAKEREKEAKRQAKAARRAQEALMASVDAGQGQPCQPAPAEQSPGMVVTAAGSALAALVAAAGAAPVAQLRDEEACAAAGSTLGSGSGLGFLPGAAAPASGDLVLRTMRGDLVLGRAGGPGGALAPGEPAARVEVCQGKACAKRGSGALLAGLAGALEGDAGVTVAACKCMDQCKKGPNLRVRVAGEPLVVAVGVPPADAARAVRRVA